MYDVSALTEEFELPVANPKILDIRDHNDNRTLRLVSRYPDTNQEVHIDIDLIGYDSNKPLTEDFLKDSAIKALKMMSKNLVVKDDLGDDQLNNYGSFIDYNKEQGTLDLESFKNLLVKNIDLRKKAVLAKEYNGVMNLMVDKMSLINAKQNLQQYFYDILGVSDK